MRFTDTEIHGVMVIAPERFADERGFFVQTWGQDDFEAHGLARMLVRNASYNAEKATLRGMHFQHPPHAEAKLVSVIAGSIYDVAVDLRKDSPTYRQWVGRELSAETGEMLYIPEGFAHGYITLEPHSTVEYLISAFYAPQAAGGVRWDDPAFGIAWPIAPKLMNARDRSWADYQT